LLLSDLGKLKTNLFKEALGPNPLAPDYRQFGSNEITGRNFPNGLETEEPEKKKKPGRNLAFRT